MSRVGHSRINEVELRAVEHGAEDDVRSRMGTAWNDRIHSTHC